MSTSSLKILCRYQYDPLDRLMGVGVLEGASTQRFYQEDHLTTELGEQTQRTIFRHEARPLAQQQNTDGVTETMLLASDQAHSLLQTLDGAESQQLAYTAYGHHPVESGLSHLLGFNGECPDAITGHYLLGQGTRAFNPVLMRFNSPDDLSPFGEGGINPYAYCEGDPINFYDPTGTVRFNIKDLFPELTRKVGFNIEDLIPEIVGSPLNTTKKTSSSIVKTGRSASEHSRPPAINQPAPNQQPSTSTLIPQQKSTKPRVRALGRASIGNSRSAAVKKKLKADAARYDTYVRDNPKTEIPTNPTLIEKLAKERLNLIIATNSGVAGPKLQGIAAKISYTELQIKSDSIRKVES